MAFWTSQRAAIAQLLVTLLLFPPNSAIKLALARLQNPWERHDPLGDRQNQRDSLPPQESSNNRYSLRVKMKHRDAHSLQKSTDFKNSLSQSLQRDVARSHGIKHRIKYAGTEVPPPVKDSALKEQKFRMEQTFRVDSHESDHNKPELHQNLEFEGAVKSGASLGSGEYFMDIFIGTPPRRIPVIIDTGSDLTWVQCAPCLHCYLQEDPVFQPRNSTSYNHVACGEPQCALVNSSHNSSTCKSSQGCSYSYWYEDSSNTTGDFATEAFTLNKTTTGETMQIQKVMFGCGHSNEGLFTGASGLLGLGQGELSFISQTGSRYGNKFSYCLVDRDNPLTVSSTIILGDDDTLTALNGMQFTPFVKNHFIDTFYYVHISYLMVGGVKLAIPNATWEISPHDGAGGTIVDSGTTLTYFPHPAYQIIRTALDAEISLPKVSSPVMPPDHLCYNITGVDRSPYLPALSIAFGNEALWHLPSKNVFIRPDPGEEILCVAILGSPAYSMTIIGNYQQQNFHMVFDRANSQLGFASRQCSSL